MEVQAETVFEAAALALRSFQEADFSAEESHWTGALLISVRQPPVIHRVTIDKLEAFANKSSLSGGPAQIVHRQKLKGILDGK